jgi:hypothetical protein
MPTKYYSPDLGKTFNTLAEQKAAEKAAKEGKSPQQETMARKADSSSPASEGYVDYANTSTAGKRQRKGETVAAYRARMATVKGAEAAGETPKKEKK